MTHKIRDYYQRSKMRPAFKIMLSQKELDYTDDEFLMEEKALWVQMFLGIRAVNAVDKMFEWVPENASGDKHAYVLSFMTPTQQKTFAKKHPRQ